MEDIPAVREFPRLHHTIDRAMRKEVRLRALLHRQKQKALAQQYKALYEQWQLRCAGAVCSQKCTSDAWEGAHSLTGSCLISDAR